MFLRKNTAGQTVCFLLLNASTGAGLTGATVAVRRCIDGTFAAATGTVTEDAGGWYKFAPSQADTNGDQIGFFFSATSAVGVSLNVRTTAADLADATRLGLTALPNAAAGANGGLPTGDASGRVAVQVGTGTGQINSSGGKVPATLASTDVTGNVAADLQTIKTQTVTCAGGVTIPAATLASTTNITAATGIVLSGVTHTGAVIPTVTTVTTTTNLTNAPTSGDLTTTMKASIQTELTTYGALKPTVAGRTLDVSLGGEAGIDWANIGSPTAAVNLSGTTISTSQVAASVTGNVGGDIAGKVLGGGAGTITGVGVRSDLRQIAGQTASAAGSVTFPSSIGTSTLDAPSARAALGMADPNLDDQISALAGYVDTEVAAILAIANKLDGMLELNGGLYRFTIAALAQAPSGGGGGSTDWTADERTAIRSILGIPGTGTAPADPTVGILDTIRDIAGGITAATAAQITSDHGSGSYVRNTEPPAAATVAGAVRTELSTELARIDQTIGSRAVAGDAMTLADNAITAAKIASNAITEAKIATPAETAGIPTGILGMARRLWEWSSRKRTRDRDTGAVRLYGVDNTTVLETQTQSTTGSVDQISKGA